MKNTLLVIVVLLVGCGKITGYDLNQPMSEERIKQRKQKKKAAEDNNTKPIKVADTNATKLTAEEQKIVGEYEIKTKGGGGIEYTERVVLLENGIVDAYVNDKKEEGEGKWKLTKEGELHTIFYGNILVYRINKDGSITYVGYTRDGKRNDDPKEEGEDAFKKIK